MTTTTRRATTNAAPPPSLRNTDAPCRETDPELFFPTGDSNDARAQAAHAKRICARCPIKADCLSWALETRQDSGVWGGMTAQERHALHGRRGGGDWARRRDVAGHMYATRLDEFRQLLADELEPGEIARAMGTNVQTVNRLLERLAADTTAAAVEEVQAA